MLRRVFVKSNLNEVLRTILIANLWYKIIWASNCIQDGTVQEGKYLNGSTFTQHGHSSLYSCAGACYAYVICRSFNFNKQTKTCFLNFADETQVLYAIKPNANFFYSRIEDWPKDVTGPCRGHSCKKGEQCVVRRQNSAVCVPSPWNKVDYRVDFVLSSEKRTWSKSAAECSKLYGNLAVVDTKEKSDTVQKLLTDNGSGDWFWLGATDEEKEGRWVWVDGQEMDFNMWSSSSPQQPNNRNQNEHCLSVANRDWFDQRCDKSYNYICEVIVN